MDLRWTDEQNRLRAQFEDFGKTEVAPRALALADQDQFDHQSWDKLALTEFWKLIVPEAYGGQGEHWWDFTAAFEGLISTAGDGGFVVSVAAQAAFIRFLFGLGFLMPVLLPALRRGFAAPVWGLFALRGALHVVAVLVMGAVCKVVFGKRRR